MFKLQRVWSPSKERHLKNFNINFFSVILVLHKGKTLKDIHLDIAKNNLLTFWAGHNLKLTSL